MPKWDDWGYRASHFQPHKWRGRQDRHKNIDRRTIRKDIEQDENQ